MKPSRVAVWVLCAGACGAWLAAAAGVPRPGRVPRSAPRVPADVKFDELAADVQSQARRLRTRLAAAPSPGATERNPFTFSARRPAAAPSAAPLRRVEVAPEPVAVGTPEPVLALIGISENKENDALVRTAMLAGSSEELIMARAGQRILSRYDVLVITSDAVELKDVETGATRRLVLR